MLPETGYVSIKVVDVVAFAVFEYMLLFIEIVVEPPPVLITLPLPAQNNPFVVYKEPV